MPALPTDPRPFELGERSRTSFLTWLGDGPFTALSAGQVRIGRARVLVLGDPSSPRLALIQSRDTPSEPAVFGPEIGSIWELLSRASGWYCVNIPSESVNEVAQELERRTGLSSTTMSERYYALEGDLGTAPEVGVRLLGPRDAEIVRGSDPIIHPFFQGHGSTELTLQDGVSAGVTDGTSVVSAVTTSAWVGSYVDLGAVTVPSSRGRGFATGSARRVCVTLRERGLAPVWAAGEPNPASWHIPERLGFRFVGRREYAIVAGLRPNGFHP